MNADSGPMLRAWLTVLLLWFVACLNYIDRVMITTMRQSLVTAIPMTEAQFGLLTTTFLLVYAVLSPIAGFLADRIGRSRVIVFSLVAWSVITWLTAHATTYGELLTTRANGAVEAKPVVLGEALRSLFGSRTFVLALACWGLLGANVWAVVGWMPTYLTERFQLTQGVGGLSATGWYQGASLVGVFLGGAWADAWSRTRPHAPMLVPLIGLCLAAPAILVAASAGGLALAVVGLALFGLTKAFTDANMMPILTLTCDPRYRATGYGVLNFFACAVGGLTIYAGGVLRDAQIDVNNIFLFGAASVTVCAVLLYQVLPRHAAPPSPTESP